MQTHFTKSFTFQFMKSSELMRESVIFRHLNYVEGNINKIITPIKYKLMTPDGLVNRLTEIFPDKVVIMDCSLFAQFYVQSILDHKNENTSYDFILSPSVDHFIEIDKSSKMLHYLCPATFALCDILRVSNCQSKGQFLVKCSETTDIYVGLTEKGILELTINEWIAKLVEDIKMWLLTEYKITDELSPDDYVDWMLLNGIGHPIVYKHYNFYIN